jgi:hypothetical protein
VICFNPLSNASCSVHVPQVNSRNAHSCFGPLAEVETAAFKTGGVVVGPWALLWV